MQQAFLPLTELLFQCSEYHQSMSVEWYHILEQESILELDSFSSADHERRGALHNLCDLDTSLNFQDNSVKIEVTLISVP